MKLTKYQLTRALLFCTGALLASCHNIDEHSKDSKKPAIAEHYEVQILEVPVTYAEPIVTSEQQVLEVPAADHVASAPNAADIAPGPDGGLGGDFGPGGPGGIGAFSPFPPPPIYPWQIKNPNSYGLMPSRFNDNPNFMFSFDVDPETAALPDNNIGPLLDYFRFDDDDGDDDF